MPRHALLSAFAACLLGACAQGGALSPRDQKPPLSAGDAGRGAADAGRPAPTYDAGPPPPPPRDAGPAAIGLDAGEPLPQPIDAGPAPDAGATATDAGPYAPSCGISAEGACDGTVAIWCGADGVEGYDCADEGLECGHDPGWGYGCLERAPPPDDPCDGVDYLGECQGQFVRWCDGTALSYVDCGSEGLRCAWVDATTGYWCTP